MIKKGIFRFNCRKTFLRFSGIDMLTLLAARMARRVRRSVCAKVGIKEQLLAAKDACEVTDLLCKARGYHRASYDTMRKWRKIGNMKLKEFAA